MRSACWLRDARRLVHVASAIVASALLCGCPAFRETTGNYAEDLVGCDLAVAPTEIACWFTGVLIGCEGSLYGQFGQCLGVDCPRSLCLPGGPAPLSTPLSSQPILTAWPAPAVAPTQRAALLAFFAATGGANWFDKTGWGGPPGTECDWFGVECNAARTSVVRLSFADNGLNGKLPPEIGNFADLQVLSLQDESFANQPIPATLTKLGNLVVLVLTDNQLSGALPSTIGKLGKLQMLVVEGQNLDGPLPSGLWTLTGLRILSLAELRGVGGALPADLAKLKNLEGLRIRETGMGGAIPAAWASLTRLQSLSLTANGVTGPIPPFLASFTQLRRLSLDGNSLTGAIPASLGGLTDLEILDLSFNQLTGPIPATFSDLDQLRLLSLVGNHLSGPLPSLAGFDELVSLAIGPAGHGGPFPASYLGLEQLQVLMLPKAGFTGPMPDLSLFSDLREVNLENNAFSPGPVPSWVGTLPELRKILLAGTNRQGAIPDLTIYQNQLTHLGLGRNPYAAGPVPAWLPQMSRLTWIDLEKTNRNGPLPPFLADLPRVEFLDLSENPFTPGALPDLTKQRFRLLSLDLGSTSRTGPLPAHLGGMSFLQRLALPDNQLTGPITKTVLPPLAVEIDLRRNRLGGPLPATLGEEGQLVSLLLSGNQFAGPVPIGLVALLDLFPGAVEHPLYGKHVGLDLRFNALTATDPTLISFAKSKHEAGVDFRASQTVPPAGGKAVALSSSSLRVTWTKIPYGGPGKYTVLMSKSAGGPFAAAGQVGPKSATAVTVTGLQGKTKYYFQLTTTTNPNKQNPGGVTSLPSAVFTVTTL